MLCIENLHFEVNMYVTSLKLHSAETSDGGWVAETETPDYKRLFHQNYLEAVKKLHNVALISQLTIDLSKHPYISSTE